MIQVLRCAPSAKGLGHGLGDGQNYRPPGPRQEHQPRAGGRLGALLNTLKKRVVGFSS